MLTGRTIAAVKSLLQRFKRSEISDLLLEAGAKPERIAAIPIVGDMHSPLYRSTAGISKLAFDSVFLDFSEWEAERVILDLIMIMARKGCRIFDTYPAEVEYLKDALREDGYSFDEIATNGAKVISSANQFDDLLPIRRRKVFDQDLIACVMNAQTKARPLCLLMLDLDKFKAINDQHGHQVGDEVLVEWARIVVAVIEGKGTAYRYGGEEVAILLPNSSVMEGEAVAEVIRKSVAGTAVSSKQLKVTVSIGLACIPDHAAEAVDLLRHADQAMYQAKRLGRNLVRISGEPEMFPAPERRIPRREPNGGVLTDEEQDHIKRLYFTDGCAKCPKDGASLEVQEAGRMGLKTPDLRVLCPLCGLEGLIPGIPV